MKKNNRLSAYPLIRLSAGLSHVEVMITIAVIGILISGVIGAFSAITKGLITSKTRTISTNLTQEKVEYLKNISYSRLLVTKQTDLDTYGYDNTYYQPETMTVGDAEFKRYTTVWKAQEEIDGADTIISTMSPTAADEGIKKIKIEVTWTEGQDAKSLVLYNFKEDTNRVSKPDSISGLITTTGTAVAIASARVEILQNINWNATTSATGYYIIKTTEEATVQVRATKDGYWPAALGDVTTTAVAQNIQLTSQSKGNASGFVYKRDHLVISEICAALTDNTTEYVELYNPTTYQITIDGAYKLRHYAFWDVTTDFPALTYVNTSVDSHKYFLIASYPAVNGITADAYYTVNENKIDAGWRAGIGLVTDTFNVWVDSIAWGPGAASPDGAKEGAGLDLTPLSEPDVAGPEDGDSIERISYSTFTTSALMWNDSNGNAYDNDKNEENWVFHDNQVNPQNSSMSETPVQGMPVGYAVVSANDGLSSSVTTDSTGYYYLTEIATGTWTIYASSLILTGIEPNTEIITDGNTNCDIVLSSVSEGGFISGRVIRGDTSVGVSGIRVIAGANPPTTTDVNGNYSFSVEVGSYTVIANPDWFSASWTSGTSDPEATAPGEVNENEVVTIEAPDLKIYPAGWISGTTYNSSGDPLPYVTVRTTSTNAGFSTDVVSDGVGDYTIKGVEVAADHNVYPVLDEAESYTPAGGYIVDLSQGEEESGKDFTVASAWGVISGSVTESGSNITTGVLIIATTDAVPADSPPSISGGVVGGAASTIYYGVISISDGTYSINVRKGAETYNMKAWYTTVSGDGVTVLTTPKTPTEGNGFLINDANPSRTRIFSWP